MSSRDSHNPVRMSPEEVRVLGYHLRLEPDAELHPEIIYLPYELVKAALYLILIDIPVTET